jgi:hypothetical protein
MEELTGRTIIVKADPTLHRSSLISTWDEVTLAPTGATSVSFPYSNRQS